MSRRCPQLAACAAALLLFGCAGEDPALRKDVTALRAEVKVLIAENEALSHKLDELSGRVDLLSARAVHRSEAHPEARSEPAEAPVVPAHLAVVKVAPARHARPAAPVSTAVPILEPDPAELPERLGSNGPGVDLAAEAESELRSARAGSGLASAKALLGFVARYPRHPQADNALVEAARGYAAAGELEPACALARRCVEEYPAGDAIPDALIELAECQARRHDDAGARALYERILSDHPRSSAASRAAERLQELSPRGGATGAGAAR